MTGLKHVLIREGVTDLKHVLIREVSSFSLSLPPSLSLSVQVCDLVLTNEGQHLVNYVKVIDNYFNVLGSLEGSIRLPHQPIEIGVAADTHR